MSGPIIYAKVINDVDADVEVPSQQLHQKNLNSVAVKAEAIPIDKPSSSSYSSPSPSSTSSSSTSSSYQTSEKCLKISMILVAILTFLLYLYDIHLHHFSPFQKNKKGQTFLSGGGRDWILNIHSSDPLINTIQAKHDPSLSLGVFPSTPLVLVDKESPDALVFTKEEVQGLLAGREVTLTDGRLGFQFEHDKDMDWKVSTDQNWIYYETCASCLEDDTAIDADDDGEPKDEKKSDKGDKKDGTKTTTTTPELTLQFMDQNFLLLKSYNDRPMATSMVLDVSNWNMEEGNTVNFVGANPEQSPSQETFVYGGGRDWVVNSDCSQDDSTGTGGGPCTIGPKHTPELVLGVGKRRLILVQSDSSAVLNLDASAMAQLANGNAIPFYVSNDHGQYAVSKQYLDERKYEEWYYIESEVVVSSSTSDSGSKKSKGKTTNTTPEVEEDAIVTIQYKDDNFLVVKGDVDGQDFVLDVSFWFMVEGNSVNYVRGNDGS